MRTVEVATGIEPVDLPDGFCGPLPHHFSHTTIGWHNERMTGSNPRPLTLTKVMRYQSCATSAY